MRKTNHYEPPRRNNNSAFGRIVAGGSILLFGLTVLSALCAGAVDAETLPIYVGLGCVCLCGVGVGLIMSGG